MGEIKINGGFWKEASIQSVDKVVSRGQGEDKKDSPRTPGADEQRETAHSSVRKTFGFDKV
ncbi:hypothetical protein [Eubacterium aggregans]|uniref:hypothetical protein n=1 Tax=Eubacterium aggregans TaxID=81409 RepID=UPI000B7E05D5|nr:hypothetical protein [Eubacterium aggregans]MDD4692535.1 hypothetical protein [Eubacterium aggregans]